MNYQAGPNYPSGAANSALGTMSNAAQTVTIEKTPHEGVWEAVPVGETQHPWIRYLSFGLFRVFSLSLDDRYLYAVDVGGCNEIHYLDRQSLGAGQKFFLKLNVDDPVFGRLTRRGQPGNLWALRAYRVPRSFRLNVPVKVLNFPPEGGCYAHSFTWSLLLRIADHRTVARLRWAESLHHSPFKSVAAALDQATRGLLAAEDFKSLMLTDGRLRAAILASVRELPVVSEPGLILEALDCHGLSGDPAAILMAQQIHRRYEECRSLGAIPPEWFKRLLELACPEEALRARAKEPEYRARLIEVLINALVAMRLPVGPEELRRFVVELIDDLWAAPADAA
ncbi:MAG TPA: hypothetical protein VF546_05905 [Pyrinomonadaceae bacterium]|jgi:hypothetical protein